MLLLKIYITVAYTIRDMHFQNKSWEKHIPNLSSVSTRVIFEPNLLEDPG